MLALYPDIQEKVYQEVKEVLRWSNDDQEISFSEYGDLSYLERVIKECLRLFPPVPFVSRKLSSDVYLEDQDITIPAGMTMHVHIFDLHRDEDQFPNPDVFDPDRFLPENISKRHAYSYIPFGAGPRNCIGQRFAILNAKTVLVELVRHFRVSAVTQRDELKFITDITLRPAVPIFIRFQRRSDVK